MTGLPVVDGQPGEDPGQHFDHVFDQALDNPLVRKPVRKPDLQPAEARRLTMRVNVAHSPAAGETEIVSVELPAGATVADALLAADAAARWPALAHCSLAVWGRRAEPSTPLAEGDRVELLRPLAADPNESRRRRYRATAGRQGGIERGRR